MLTSACWMVDFPFVFFLMLDPQGIFSCFYHVLLLTL